MASEELEQTAEHGKLAFDIFALENWAFDKPADIENDQGQWNSLARRWLNLHREERLPYYLRSEDVPPPHPTEIQIRRVLRPHQTVQERNISATLNGQGQYTPVWLRTCYDPALQSRYEEMRAQVHIISPDMATAGDVVLDDAWLYGFGEEWGKILLRLPQLVNLNTVQDNPDEELYFRGNDDAVAGDGQQESLDEADAKVRNLIYVVDEEAMRSGAVKIKWLGECGDVVWENTILPSSIEPLSGALLNGTFLTELVNDWDSKGLITR